MLESITTQELAQMLGADLNGPPDIKLGDLAGIDEAAPGSLTFIRSSEYARKWEASEASAALVSRGLEVPGHDPSARALLVVENADQSLVALLAELQRLGAAPPPPEGVHPSAVVDPSATVHPSASVGPLCVIGAGASIGEGTILFNRISVGPGARIGARTVVHAGVSIAHTCVVGDDCLIFANASIGADGFGYIPHPSGQGLLKVPHLGNVVIGNDVEIGACACIDRGKFKSTSIGDGVKIDNLVQIGHNVEVGPHTVLCGQVGLGGSSSIGAGTLVGGQVGVSDNIKIGAMARVGAQSGVLRNVEPGTTLFGTPARKSLEAFRSYQAPERQAKQIRELKRRLDALEADRHDERAP